MHGRITPRAEEVCRLVGYSDSAKVTDNLWGERWSKLVANVTESPSNVRLPGTPGGAAKNTPGTMEYPAEWSGPAAIG